MDDARGLHGDHLIYNDLRDADAINALPDNKFHRHVDVPIIKADEEGYLRSYIVAPGTPSLLFLSPLCPCGPSESASGVNGANLMGQGIYSARPPVHSSTWESRIYIPS